MRYLNAWNEGVLVGTFTQHPSGRIDFAYSDDAAFPLSLSLPMQGGWAESAPRHFLDGLLPDRRAERERMAQALGAKGLHLFDLLAAVDTIGGIAYTDSAEPPLFTLEHLAVMTPSDVEAQMQQVWSGGTTFAANQPHKRFSLSGSQGKFTISIHGEHWFWPSAALASTHILKPDGKAVRDVATVEHATMELARMLGLEVPVSQVVTFGDNTGYLIERFDRQKSSEGYVSRLHVEDLCQSLGRSGKDKYDCEMVEIFDCLRRAALPEEELYRLVRMIAFNDLVGNSDAHAKNYSVLLGSEEVHIAPLYDSVCMAHWADFRYDTMAMSVNDVYDPWEVTLFDWEEEARQCGLDADRVVAIVSELARDLREFDWSRLPCSQEVFEEIRNYTQECGRDIYLGLAPKTARHH